MRRRSVWLVLLVVVACVGHWAYWYRPRERAGAPSAESVAGALFLGADLPYAAWVPYPHQNAATLETAIGDLEAFIEALAVIADRDVPRLPSFGSARVPPSSELALASDAEGETFVAVAKVYPIAGLLARWAGRLAGNPLLAGGAAQIDGRDVEVRWADGSWIVATKGLEVPSYGAEEREGEALLWARLRKARGYLPPGEYRLERDGSALELVTGERATLQQLAKVSGTRPPVPLLLAELEAGGGAGRSLALLPGIESIGGLPGAVTLHRGNRRWRLPGERLLKLVGDGPPSARIEGWKAVALEERSLRKGASLGGFLGSLDGAPVSLVVWIDLRQARRLVDQTVAALEAVPVVGRREARRWRALAVVLDPLAHGGWLTATISERANAVHLRLGLEPEGAESLSVD